MNISGPMRDRFLIPGILNLFERTLKDRIYQGCSIENSVVHATLAVKREVRRIKHPDTIAYSHRPEKSGTWRYS